MNVTFMFSRTIEGELETTEHTEEFDSADSSLQTTVNDRTEEIREELNAEVDTGWDFDEYEISDWDADYANPALFSDLNEYGEYAEKVEEHGHAYHLRWEDVGDHDFDTYYRGCWDSEEEFARELFENYYDIPSVLEGYIDWDRVVRDVMMDYSSYETDEGFHIFRD